MKAEIPTQKSLTRGKVGTLDWGNDIICKAFAGEGITDRQTVIKFLTQKMGVGEGSASAGYDRWNRRCKANNE